MSLLQILTLIGALGMFLYGMNLMSGGLQKAAGKGLRRLLASFTSNPFKGVLTGLGTTAIIQSSSATTVMVVSFVNAGLLTLVQAIGVIMGSNIGTTVTAWIVSVFGFKFDIALLAVPFMAIGFILSLSKQDRTRSIGESVIGFSLLFLGLSFMKNSVPSLESNPEAFAFVQNWSGHGLGSVLLFLMFGTLLTVVLQSSSATVAFTLIMVSMGWIQFPMAAAMVLGENIGTTITANIAAVVASRNAKRAALAHTVFNVIGVIWAVAFFNPFLGLVEKVIHALGLDSDPSQTYLYSVSMMHTMFNLINTTLLIWFIPLIAKLVTWIIPDKAQTEEDKALKLTYIHAGFVPPTPELAVIEASNETVHFGKIMQKGLAYVRKAIETADDPKEFEFYRKKLVRYEEVSDRIEVQIFDFIDGLDRTAMSEETQQKARSLKRIAGELESLGDSGEAISRALVQKNDHGNHFSKEHLDALDQMVTVVDEAFDVMNYNLANFDTIQDINNAVDAEIAVNARRDALRNKEYVSGAEGDAYFNSMLFLKVLDELERMGDFIINVSQAIMSCRRLRK